MVVPPFAGVALVEVRDEIQIRPYAWCREFLGMGKCRGRDVLPEGTGFLSHWFSKLIRWKKVWVVVAWRQYEDGTEETLRCHILDPQATEADARKSFQDEVRFMQMSREEVEEIMSLYKTTDDDLLYLETRYPKFLSPPPGSSLEERDLYQARLKVMAGMQPRTVALIYKAHDETDPKRRAEIEREAVKAFFADMAHQWDDETLSAWLKTNPAGLEWLNEFARVRSAKKLELDSVNYELVLNWLRQKYNLLTAEELSQAILETTGKKIRPASIKKRRERLGLTTKRSPGPRPKSEG